MAGSGTGRPPGMARLMQSPHVDFVAVTASYFDRELGRGADYARAPITSAALHGKLWYHDNDTVSFRYDAMNADRADRATVERYRRELGVTSNVEETVWQYRRGAGFVLGNGIFQSFFDLHGGYFDDPRLMAEVGRLNRLLSDAGRLDRSSVAEILVVSDEDSCGYATFGSGLLQQTLQPMQVQLAKLGAPHDSILLQDLGRVDVDRYRLVIFLNCFHLTGAQRRLIRRKLLNRGRTMLWCHAAGWFNGARALDAGMEALTGMRIVPGRRGERVRARIELTDPGLRFASAAPGSPIVPGVIGHEHVWTRLFSVDDDRAESLGILEGRSATVLAMRRMPHWTSVYSLNPVLPAVFLRALARRAGVHLYSHRDDTLYASRSFLCLNADGGGRRTVHFPRPTTLFDPFSGRRLWRDCPSVDVELVPKETVLWRLA